MKGQIKQIVDMEKYFKIVIHVEDTDFIAQISKSSFYEMKLKFDIPVYATFKASAVKVY